MAMNNPQNIFDRSEEVADYFRNDLMQLVKETGIDLVEAFQIPSDYPQDTNDICIMLYDDIARMLRDGLITGIHIIISDNEMDKGTNAYKMRYHAHYEISNLDTPDAGTRQGIFLNPPKRIWHNSRFALLIDWTPSLHGQQKYICRPDYNFDWVLDDNHYDASGMLGDINDGSLTSNSLEIVVRDEQTSLSYHEDISL